MFGRNPSQDPKPVSPAQPQSQNSSAPMAGSTPAAPTPSAMPGGSGASIIGSDLSIFGEKINIVCQTKVEIGGDVRADVSGKEVVVGKAGKVSGTITAEKVDVRGRVEGAIRGKAVTLHQTAHVEGDIHHQSLAIAEGAEFDGGVRRAKDAKEVTPVLDPAAFVR